MVTEKDLKIGVEWSYENNKYRFITNPKNGCIEFINLTNNHKYKNFRTGYLLKGFNNKTYILYKSVEKIYELW